MSRFLLPLTEYNRVYQVVHGVLLGIPEANAEKACTFFATFGAYVLNREYGIDARVVAGAFSFAMSDAEEIAFFGRIEKDQLVSADDAFHMWVQTKTHVFDFMAPIYREAFAARPGAAPLPRKMMQRRLEDEAPSLDALRQAGDFRYYPNPDLTQELTDHFFDRQLNADLLNVATAWYGKRRARQAPTFAMADEKGTVTHLALANTTANGAW
ncbi:hypothetical protein ABIC78_000019 [Novosphingobium sp. 1529]